MKVYKCKHGTFEYGPCADCPGTCVRQEHDDPVNIMGDIAMGVAMNAAFDSTPIDTSPLSDSFSGGGGDFGGGGSSGDW
jgi:hypothetical protein